MTGSLNRLTIRGFKSIRELEGFELRNLNILIGANGAGKSNLISFFQMLKSQADGTLESYIVRSGGVGDIIHNGHKTAKKIEFEAYFGSSLYRLSIVPRSGKGYDLVEPPPLHISNVEHEAGFENASDNKLLAVREEGATYSNEDIMKLIYKSIRSWKTYHFHDAGATAAMRRSENIQDNEYLRPDASNIAPYLLRLREEHPFAYREILSGCRIVAPFVDDFILEPEQFGPDTKVSLTWKAKGSNRPMQAYHLSGGAIRFICLATALLQPNLPSMIIIDEPELSLHPTAIHLVNELIESAAKQVRIIVTTQSPLLLDYFSVEDVVVVRRNDGQSTFKRLHSKDFKLWLDEYSVGGLWLKNVIPGDITCEQ